jgi:hypothetical protein
MSKSEDAKKLGQAVESLASTIIQIIETKVRLLAEQTMRLQAEQLAKQPTPESEGWVARGKRQST